MPSARLKLLSSDGSAVSPDDQQPFIHSSVRIPRHAQLAVGERAANLDPSERFSDLARPLRRQGSKTPGSLLLARAGRLQRLPCPRNRGQPADTIHGPLELAIEHRAVNPLLARPRETRAFGAGDPLQLLNRRRARASASLRWKSSQLLQHRRKPRPDLRPVPDPRLRLPGLRVRALPALEARREWHGSPLPHSVSPRCLLPVQTRHSADRKQANGRSDR
jgi:hypothetical protein